VGVRAACDCLWLVGCGYLLRGLNVGYRKPGAHGPPVVSIIISYKTSDANGDAGMAMANGGWRLATTVIDHRVKHPKVTPDPDFHFGPAELGLGFPPSKCPMAPPPMKPVWPTEAKAW
jgi:hypothetical protein